MTDWIFESSDASWLKIPGPHGPDNLNHGPDNLNHAPEYLLNDDGQLSIVQAAKSHGGGGGGSGGSGSGTGSPASTLVGTPAGLEINLIWDSSVRSAANWSDIEHAVVQAVTIYTTNFLTHAILNIQVGLGEVAGSAMGAGALGESETLGYGVGYATLTKALAAADAGLTGMASGAVTAVGALAAKTFFVASAEAKALGLINPMSTAVDGYIGLAKGAVLAFTGTPGAAQYDAVGVAAHELSEVMGRIGMEGGGRGYYTPLDLFRYSALNTPDLTPTAGYFSLDMGATRLNDFNDPKNGGDAADWAQSSASTDSFNAFGSPGVTTQVTATDLLAVAALGYHPAGPLTTVTA